MKLEDWKDRIAERADISTRLVHLTKPAKIDDGEQLNALEVLLNILEDKCIMGSTTKSGYICGDTAAVCFQDAPIYSIAQNVYYEQKLRKKDKSIKVRYMGWGIVFKKNFIYKKGGRPVVYDKTDDAKKYLLNSEWWRIVNFDLANDEYIIDWTHEREWRLPGDLCFELEDISILTPSNKAQKKLIKEYKNRFGSDIFNDTNGIINLGEIFY